MSGCAAACSTLLDIPDDPYLAEPPLSPTGGASLPTEMQTAPLRVDPEVADPANELPTNELPFDDGTEVAGNAVTSDPDAPDAAPAPDVGAPAAATCPAPERQGPNGHCYATVTTLLPWVDAQLSCRSRGPGWDLAAIRDEASNTFLSALNAGDAWVGGSDATTEGTWLWVIDAEPFWSGDGVTGNTLNGAFENWNSDEPNGADNSDCLRLVAQLGTWADLECAMLRASICEGPAP